MKSVVLDALQYPGVKKDSFMGFWLASAVLGEMEKLFEIHCKLTVAYLLLQRWAC